MRRGKPFSTELIVAKLCQIEVQLAYDKSLALACKDAGIAEQNSGMIPTALMSDRCEPTPAVRLR